MSSSRAVADEEYELQGNTRAVEAPDHATRDTAGILGRITNPDIEAALLRKKCKRRMLRSGWCHHRVRYLASAFDLHTFSHLSRLKYLRETKHDICREQSSCVAYSVNTLTYQTRHVTSDCTCTFVETPFEDLKRIAGGGGVPLIRIEHDKASGYKLRVQKRKQQSQYVAISHVWADGLGNQSQCALPACQIERLHTITRSFSSLRGIREKLTQIHPLIWMDTLCIPPQDLSLRKAQIDKMASIYKGAVSCFVLDHELMTISPSEVHILDLYARIICSAWNCRSWTLQEGALPPHLTLLFAHNALVSLQHGKLKMLYPRTQHMRDQEESLSKVESVLMERLNVSCDMSRKWDFASVWNELIGRSTSQPADIALIVANLLNLEIGKLLLYARPEQQFQAILLSYGSGKSRNLMLPGVDPGDVTVPLSLFSNIGPRHQTKGDAQEALPPRWTTTGGGEGGWHYMDYNTGRTTSTKPLAGNSWVPTAIGREPLKSRPYFRAKGPASNLDIQRSSELYGLDDSQALFYTFNAEDYSPISGPIQFEGDDAVYSSDPPNLYVDDRDRDFNLKLCIIVEQAEEKRGQWPLEKRASCFTVSRITTGSSRPDGTWLFELIFRGPLRLESIRSMAQKPLNEINGVFCVKPLRHKQLRLQVIIYLLPGTEPLHQRSTLSSYKLTRSRGFFAPHQVIWYLCCIPGLAYGTFGLWKVLRDAGWLELLYIPVIVTWIVGPAVIIASRDVPNVLIMAFLRLWNNFGWRNIRAYEVVPRPSEPPIDV